MFGESRKMKELKERVRALELLVGVDKGKEDSTVKTELEKIRRDTQINSDHMIPIDCYWAVIMAPKRVGVADVLQQVLDHLGLKVSYTPAEEKKMPEKLSLVKVSKKK